MLEQGWLIWTKNMPFRLPTSFQTCSFVCGPFPRDVKRVQRRWVVFSSAKFQLPIENWVLIGDVHDTGLTQRDVRRINDTSKDGLTGCHWATIGTSNWSRRCWTWMSTFSVVIIFRLDIEICQLCQHEWRVKMWYSPRERALREGGWETSGVRAGVDAAVLGCAGRRSLILRRGLSGGGVGEGSFSSSSSSSWGS